MLWAWSIQQSVTHLLQHSVGGAISHHPANCTTVFLKFKKISLWVAWASRVAVHQSHLSYNTPLPTLQTYSSTLRPFPICSLLLQPGDKIKLWSRPPVDRSYLDSSIPTGAQKGNVTLPSCFPLPELSPLLQSSSTTTYSSKRHFRIPPSPCLPSLPVRNRSPSGFFFHQPKPHQTSGVRPIYGFITTSISMSLVTTAIMVCQSLFRIPG